MAASAHHTAEQCIEASQLGQLVELGHGAQGTVYRAPKIQLDSIKSAAFKRYTSDMLAQLDLDRLRHWASFPFTLSAAEGETLIERAAWPIRLVCQSHVVQGFLMPEIPQGFMIELTLASGRVEKPAALQHLLNDDDFVVRRGISVTDRARFQLLADVAEGLSFLHGHDIAVGDFSAKNLLFQLGRTPKCLFIDCDAMTLHGETVLPQLETPDWSVRAVSDEPLATPESDSYKLALLVLRLLARDQTTRRVRDLPATVPRKLREFVEHGLDASPARRPSPDEWIDPLHRAAKHARSTLTATAKTTAAKAKTVRPKTTPKSTTMQRLTSRRTTATAKLKVVTPRAPARLPTNGTAGGRSVSSPPRHARPFLVVRRFASLAAIALFATRGASIAIAARSGVVTWLDQLCRWQVVACAAIVAGITWAIAAVRVRKLSYGTSQLRSTALLPFIALLATVSAAYTEANPHWVYRSVGQIEDWVIQREDVIAGLPDRGGSACELPIATAEALGADRSPLVVYSHVKTSAQRVLLCVDPSGNLVLFTVPEDPSKEMTAIRALSKDGAVISDAEADGSRQHFNGKEWWRTDSQNTVVEREGGTSMLR